MEFRLLVETSEPSSQPSFPLEGRYWTLSPTLDLDGDEDIPRFACISYRWGPAREQHALDGQLTMSTHTLPSLAAVIRNGACNAFWTDVFCVPSSGPERQPTLENMGYIYSRASEVIIVLGEDTFSVMRNIIHDRSVCERDLEVLERDEWVSSVWTYQEIVNATAVSFVSEHQEDSNTSIEGSQFFSALGHGLMKWQNSTGSDPFGAMRKFPNLNALETILADWQIADYTRRSALGIFTSMAFKRNPDPENYFYAILGSLTRSRQQLVWNAGQNLAEKVMDICESKNDFSYIYTVAPRDTEPGRQWRPQAVLDPAGVTSIPAVLRPILAWHTWGETQDGHYDEGGLRLHGMTIMSLSPSAGNSEKKSIAGWLHQPALQDAQDAVLATAVYTAVSSVGFEGKGTPIIVSGGYVFPLQTVERETIARILVSNQIRWSMGAPGLVHVKTLNGYEYVPCIFIGSTLALQGEGQSVLL